MDDSQGWLKVGDVSFPPDGDGDRDRHRERCQGNVVSHGVLPSKRKELLFLQQTQAREVCLLLKMMRRIDLSVPSVPLSVCRLSLTPKHFPPQNGNKTVKLVLTTGSRKFLTGKKRNPLLRRCWSPEGSVAEQRTQLHRFSFPVDSIHT